MEFAALRYLFAIVACAAMTLIAVPLSWHLDLANVIMLFLLEVMSVALYLGRGPAIWAAFLSVACFDFFFVPPKLTFAVEDPQYLVTFVVMLAVAVVIGQLTAKLSLQAQTAAAQARSTRALAALAQDLMAATEVAAIAAAADRCLRDAFGAEAALLVRNDNGQFASTGVISNPRLHISNMMAAVAYENTACIDNDSPYPVSYLPLKSGKARRHVLAAISPTHSAFVLTEHKDFLQTAAALIALGLDRLQAARSAARTVDE